MAEGLDLEEYVETTMYEEEARDILEGAKGKVKNSTRMLCDTAIKVLMGSEWDVVYYYETAVKFKCMLCSTIVNSLTCAEDHKVSKFHMRTFKNSKHNHKNLVPMITSRRAASVGLQLVEEHITPSKHFVMCDLCSFVGEVNDAYHHVIGTEHIDNYLKSRGAIEETGVDSWIRQKLVKKIIRKEGTRLKELKTVEKKTK